jgi:hypothetical protein
MKRRAYGWQRVNKTRYWQVDGVEATSTSHRFGMIR